MNKVIKVINLILPTAIIVSQFIRIGPLNLSWIIYFFILIYVLPKINVLFEKNSNIILFIVVLLYSLISFFWSIAVVFPQELFLSLTTGLFTFYYIQLLNDEQIDSFIKGVLISCIYFIMHGLYEISSGNYIFATNTNFIDKTNAFRQNYPIVAFPNANDYSQYIAILLPIASTFLFPQSKLIYKFLFFGLNFLGLFVIYQSESNLSMIVIFFTYFLSFAFYFKSAIVLQTLLTSIVPIVLISLYIESNYSFFTDIFDYVFFINTDDPHYIIRHNLYSDLMHEALSNPIGGFGTSYALSQRLYNFPPHNMFLFILCDYGFIFCFMFIGFITKQFVLLYKHRAVESSSFLATLSSTLLMLPVSLAISSGSEQRKCIWITFGIIIYFSNMVKQAKPDKTTQVE